MCKNGGFWALIIYSLAFAKSVFNQKIILNLVTNLAKLPEVAGNRHLKIFRKKNF